MRGIRAIAAMLIEDHKRIQRCMVITRSTKKPQRSSNKSKMKQTKSKPSNKYKSSKPMKSKAVSQFRNKSNI